MSLPEQFKPQFIEEWEEPLPGVFYIKSEDRINGEINNASYIINHDWGTQEGTVIFDSIEFRNDQYSLTTDDYIQENEYRYFYTRNATFTQASETIADLKTFIESATSLIINYDNQNPFTIRASFSIDLPTTFKMSYRMARLLGLWTPGNVINSNKDISFNPFGGITGKPIIPFISKYRWTVNFGPVAHRVSAEGSQQILSEGNFGYPNQLLNIQGNSIRDSYVSVWNIRLVDDQDIPIEIFTDYEIKFRVVNYHPSRYVQPKIPDHWKNLFSKDTKPFKITKDFYEEIKAIAPELLPKAVAFDAFARYQDMVDSLKDINIHPSRSEEIQNLETEIQEYQDIIDRIVESLKNDENYEYTAVGQDGQSLLSLQVAKLNEDIHGRVGEYKKKEKDLQKSIAEKQKELNIYKTHALTAIGDKIQSLGEISSVERKAAKENLTVWLNKQLFSGKDDSLSLRAGMKMTPKIAEKILKSMAPLSIRLIAKKNGVTDIYKQNGVLHVPINEKDKKNFSEDTRLTFNSYGNFNSDRPSENDILFDKLRIGGNISSISTPETEEAIAFEPSYIEVAQDVLEKDIEEQGKGFKLTKENFWKYIKKTEEVEAMHKQEEEEAVEREAEEAQKVPDEVIEEQSSETEP